MKNFSELVGAIGKVLICLVLVFAIGVVCRDILQQYQVRNDVQHWAPVTAQVSGLRVDEFRNKSDYSYLTHLIVRYSYRGQHFESIPLASELPLMRTKYERLGDATATARGVYPVDAQVKVLVNPQKPTEVRLLSDRTLSISPASIVLLVIFVLFLIGLMAAMYFNTLKHRKTEGCCTS
jgi:hypothetical protein